ncbi:hypothetical protein SCHPADRAFT_816328 [Schizopora paradoxa]|uniref:RNA-dependent RNA polymerase n=1 Tax=Schizopora paradoxa TaxID=27342 RepID=A0A0H2S9Q5_9AGAM|nr:hypothetical protein SCHPADRAFT_816328 [Schizopora paradoxa]
MDDDDEWDAELTDLTENVNLLDLGGKLEPFLIAHDREAVIRMNKANIAWGVQYEIARGVSQKSWTWADVTDERLEMLQGSNLEKAPLVIDVFGKGPGTLEAFLQAEKIFGELDREQKAKLENEGRGLGLRGAWEGVEDWYGGRVQQIARLRKVPGVEGYSIMLDRMQHGKSNRVTRFFGSRSILQIRIEEKLVRSQGTKIMEFLSRRQVICGRIFYPFFAKENKVYLVECNEDLDRKTRISEGDQYRISWKGFISWHNPMELNRHQPISKWSTRWALVLSTSKPVLMFDPRNIFFIDDICEHYANGYLQSTEEIMTDGCGFMNWSACRAIGIAMQSQILPIVIQGRIAGAKGLWLLHPDAKHHDQSEPPMIWIRSSQNKIQLPPLETLDRSHCILDLVRLPRLTVPSAINRQTITNLSANGVPDSAIEKLLEEGLLSEIEPLTNWTAINFRAHLAKAIENAGGLVGGRRGRQAGLEARAFTYIPDESDENEDLRDGAYKDGLVDRYAESGCPTNLYEVARELLLAGFSPLELSLLRDKLKKIIEMVTRTYVDQYRISVPYSVEAFIVPDPVGVLEEGEIFFRSSERFGDELSIDPTTFTGPVLVMRNPTMVASDIQKVNAVSRDELLSYVNVIVFSTKGSQSLASYLGGGDTVTILADRSIVDTFKNAKTVREPNDLRDNFQPEIEKVSAFCDRISNMDDATQAYELGKKLLAGLSDSKVGMYSRFHENVVYSRGYSDPEAIRLAYMFTTCLDATKSGLRLKDDVYDKDHKRFFNPQPEYVLAKDGSEFSGIRIRPENVRQRPRSLGPFILDTLRKRGLKLQHDVLARYNNLCNGLAEAHDVDLLKPYERVMDWLKEPENATRHSSLSDELFILRQHIQEMYWKFKKEVSAYDFQKRNPGLDKEGHRGLSRRALVQEIVTEFWNSASGSKLKDSKTFLNPKEYMASYAYQFSFSCGVGDRNKMYAKDFAFAVAHSELCSIKATASESGGFFATRRLADYLMLHGPLLKASVKAAGN